MSGWQPGNRKETKFDYTYHCGEGEFRGYINVLVTQAGDDRVTIDAEEDLIEMYLLLNLRPRVEEITDEY